MFSCGNLGKVKELYHKIELEEYPSSEDQYFYDWKAKYYYLIKCNVCDEISLCTFETNGFDEIGYELYINECEDPDSSTCYDKNFRLRSSNFTRLFPAYNKKNITNNKLLDKNYKISMEVYRQAQIAENLNLNEICGIGYRKALEFLIKDYCIENNTNKEENIKSGNLSDVIKKYIENDTLKQIALRAVWLGNDETHYTRIWTNKDIEYLKYLIELVFRLIEGDKIAAELIIEMPNKNKK